MTAFPSSNLFASPRTPMRVARSTMLVISPPVRLAGERHFWFTRRGFRNDTLGLELLGKCRTFTNASERDSRFESSQLRHPVHENRGGFRVWRNFGHNSDLPGRSAVSERWSPLGSTGYLRELSAASDDRRRSSLSRPNPHPNPLPADAGARERRPSP